jgi:ABC-2 type transport system permease protein
MYRLMIIQFLRNKIAVVSLVLLLASGIISLVVGKNFLAQQQAAIDETAAYQKEHIARLVKYENREMGLLLYYLKFAYVNPTSNLAGLSIGQRDINSSIQAPTIRTLEAQKYDTEIRNPYYLMTGNFDLSFVILYLFPLVIIALSFNLYSEEMELGTWPLVRSQNISSRKYLLTKISVPYVFITAVLLLLYALAAIFLRISFNKVFTAYMLGNFLYVSFWFSVALLVISFFKSSSVNAVVLLSTWLLLNLLLPAAVNNHITRKYPVPESLSTMLKQRDGYHKKWDLPEDSTMTLFFKEYPEYSTYKWTNEGLSWIWYYAMQHMGDVDAREDKNTFMQKLYQRENLSKKLSRFIPTLYTQLYNTDLAQSSLSNHLKFLDSTTNFHERLRKYFYPKIFTAAPVLQEDWIRHVPEYCNIKSEVSLVDSVYVGLFVIMFGAISIARLKYLP